MLAAESGLMSGMQVVEAISLPRGRAHAEWLFAPGTVVASRFQILQPLGRGGMGEVYEALDDVKNVPVALKVMLPNRGLDPQMADRLLRREFSLAQLVSHRNICRIYDPYQHQPSHGPPMLVVSMELLRGQTLAALLERRGRLEASEVASIGRQLAAGIDAAHAAGIAHRDLKPSNVILVEEDGRQRVVITDFGLARREAAQSVPQLSRAVAGTLRYMAPEQIEGRADKRSDLYAFAIILYELLTGQLPFVGESDLSLALSRVSTPPRDPATLTPGIPLAWRATLLRGLSRRPEKRFHSAEELIQAIDTPPPPLVLLKRLLALRARGVPRLWRWSAALALLSVFTVAAVLLRPAPSPFPGFSRLLIAELRHPETKDGALLGADASFVAAVGQSPHLSVVRPSEFGGTLAKMGRRADSPVDDETLRQLAMRTGEDTVLSGSISKAHGYLLHLHLEEMGRDPRRPAAALTRDFQAANEKDLFDAIASAASWIRKLSGEGSRELNEQNARPEDLTTSSWEALRLLDEARARRASNDPRGALIFAREALDLDPDFAAAESFSADTHTDLFQFREAFEGYKRALDLVKQRNVTGRERYEIEAAYNEDAGNDEALLATYTAWIAHFPRDYLPHFYLGHLLFHRGDYPLALTELQRAEQLRPGYFVTFPHLAAAYLANGQFEEAQRCAARLRELGEEGWALEVEGLIVLAHHQFEQAAGKIAPLANRQDGVFSSLEPRYAASALADAGLLHKAEEALSRADLEHDTDSRARFADRQLEIAFLRWTQGDYNGTRAALAPVADLDNPDSLSLAGALLARVGDLRGAEHVLALTSRWPPVASISRASQRIKLEIALAKHGSLSNAALAKMRDSVPSPLDLECLLHFARSTGQNTVAENLRREIRARSDILLSWDERQAPPGLYWLASCRAECRSAGR